ncbi:MAG TPA: protein translocase subunit SecD [Pyrinomonadaceae bacterium]|nr:protein translocase subunit SecD [Pyrinomonadaceae bacterium]HMP65673.1 protein translocase subunit SecD [Pyrinomonadaceae bacterium]
MKNRSLLIRTAIIFAVTLLGIYLVLGPSGRAPNAQDLTWAGIKANLSENINLGLDLKGGSHLVMRVLTDDYLKTLTENNAQAALVAAEDAKLPVSGSRVVAEDGDYAITLELSDAGQAEAVSEEVKKKVDLLNWSESVDGSTITWSLPSSFQTVLKNQAVEQALRIIESRIDQFGVTEPTLQRHGSDASAQILLQMPGLDDPERVKIIIGAESNLMLAKVVSPPSPSPVQTYSTREAALQSLGGAEPPNRRVLPYLERDEVEVAAKDGTKPPSSWVVIEHPPVVDGSELRDAQAVTRTGNEGDYQISFSLKPAGAQKFGEWTGRNINNYMAVVLGGELGDQVKSVAYIRSQIFDQGEISGRFTKATAEDLALTLRSGALPAKIEYLEERTVGPSLGADSIRAGVTASLAGIAFIVVFMLFYYRASGINAVVALFLNMLLTGAALILLDATLTLPGIAGFILGIGMAVDSNVLVFERMREELRAGRPVAEAVANGFDRAFITIVDSNVTTIISAVILYLYGSGPIRGFAVTLILSLLINLFSAVFVSRTIYMWLLEKNPARTKLSI